MYGSSICYLVLEAYDDNLCAYLHPECHKAIVEMVTEKVLLAIQALHSYNIMHGDIKPHNILVKNHNNGMFVT